MATRLDDHPPVRSGTDDWRVVVIFRTRGRWQRPTKARTYHFPTRAAARAYLKRLKAIYVGDNCRQWLIAPGSALKPNGARPMTTSESDSTHDAASPTTLGDALPRECARVRDLMPLYAEIDPGGAFALALMRQAIGAADRAMISGDVVGMLRAYEALKWFTS